MDILKQKVINSLKWKKNSSISAERCDMDEDDYKELKRKYYMKEKKIEKEVSSFIKLLITHSL